MVQIIYLVRVAVPNKYVFYIFFVQMQRVYAYLICSRTLYRLVNFQEFLFLQTRTECTLAHVGHVLGRDSNEVPAAALALSSLVGI
jgi:hypothetical protein